MAPKPPPRPAPRPDNHPAPPPPPHPAAPPPPRPADRPTPRAVDRPASKPPPAKPPAHGSGGATRGGGRPAGSSSGHGESGSGAARQGGRQGGAHPPAGHGTKPPGNKQVKKPGNKPPKQPHGEHPQRQTGPGYTQGSGNAGDDIGTEAQEIDTLRGEIGSLMFDRIWTGPNPPKAAGTFGTALEVLFVGVVLRDGFANFNGQTTKALADSEKIVTLVKNHKTPAFTTEKGHK